MSRGSKITRMEVKTSQSKTAVNADGANLANLPKEGRNWQLVEDTSVAAPLKILVDLLQKITNPLMILLN